MIKVNEDYCPQDHVCPVIRRCPVGAITQKYFQAAPSVDQEKCTDCGICTKICRAFNKA